MKKVFFILILLMSMATMLSAQTYPVVVAGNWNVYFYNPAQPRANDFHICGVIQSLYNYQPRLMNHVETVVSGTTTASWYLEEFTIERVANYPKNWYFTAHYKTDGYIASGTMMHFGLFFRTNYSNMAMVNCAYWTYNSQAVGRVPVIGFNIYRNRVSMVQLFNSTDQPVVLTNVEFAITKASIPLEDMFTKGIGNPGEKSMDQYQEFQWKSALKELVLEPGKDMEVALPEILGRSLEKGEFLYLRGYTIYQNKPVPWWIQHEESGLITTLDKEE